MRAITNVHLKSYVMVPGRERVSTIGPGSDPKKPDHAFEEETFGLRIIQVATGASVLVPWSNVEYVRYAPTAPKPVAKAGPMREAV